MNADSRKMKHGTYRHYRRMPDGSLRYLGEVAYSYPAEQEDGWRDTCRAQELAWRDEDELENRAAECEDFEALADAACETEG